MLEIVTVTATIAGSIVIPFVSVLFAHWFTVRWERKQLALVILRDVAQHASEFVATEQTVMRNFAVRKLQGGMTKEDFQAFHEDIGFRFNAVVATVSSDAIAVKLLCGSQGEKLVQSLEALTAEPPDFRNIDLTAAAQKMARLITAVRSEIPPVWASLNKWW